MKKLIILILGLMLICSTAFAAPLDEYKLTNLQNPPIDELLKITFGDNASKAKNNQFRAGKDYYLVDDFYEIPNNPNNVFLLQSVYKKSPNQSRIYSYMNRTSAQNDDSSGIWQTNSAENFEVSGEAKGTLKRADAIKRADDILAKLGLNNFSFINIVALGAEDIPEGDVYPKIVHYYEALYRQNINGMPIYLSSPFFEEESDGTRRWVMDSLNAKITVSDENFDVLDMQVSQTIALNNALEDIGEAKAMEIYNSSGIKVDKLELCYLVRVIGQDTIATPAYRYLNNYLSATNGEWLQ